MWSWQNGRQGTGYEKLRVFQVVTSLIAMDLYILRYRPGAHIPIHTDQVTNRKHYRANLVLKHAEIGGQFICLYPIFRYERLSIFRPDLSSHCVTRVTKGTRYVLSLGVAI